VAGAGPIPLLVRPSMVDVAGPTRPSLLRQKESTLAAMVAVCFLGKHELVTLPVDCSHGQCMLVPCQQHCSGAVSHAELYFVAFLASTFCSYVSALVPVVCR
jgi:hypothetical protein